jgi:hypothetical protein
MLLKIVHFALYTSPLSVQALQSRSCLSYFILCYNGSLFTCKVVSFAADKFKPILRAHPNHTATDTENRSSIRRNVSPSPPRGPLIALNMTFVPITPHSPSLHFPSVILFATQLSALQELISTCEWWCASDVSLSVAGLRLQIKNISVFI